MSAWTVSKTHVDVLVAGVLQVGGYHHRGVWCPIKLENATALGQMLWRENFRSVNYRYGERKSTPPYAYAAPDAYTRTSREWGQTIYLDEQSRVDPAVLAKQVSCYDYQSCEHAAYNRSRAHSVVQALAGSLLRNVKGYDEAPWGV